MSKKRLLGIALLVTGIAGLTLAWFASQPGHAIGCGSMINDWCMR